MKRLPLKLLGTILLVYSSVVVQAADVPASQPAAIDINNPPKGVFSDEWYVLMLDGHKSGHMHTTMERAKRDGRDIISTNTTMAIEVGRAETPIRMTFDQSSEETIAGEPVGFKQRMMLGKIPSTTTGEIKNGKVVVKTSQFGITTGRQTYDLPDGAIMSWGTYREQIKRGLKTGTKYEISVYEPSISMDKLTPTTMEVLGEEELDLFGRTVKAYRTKQTARIKGGLLGGETAVETTTWMTDAGSVVKLQMSVPLIDVPFEVITCSKSVALARNEPAELMLNTLIHIDRELDGQHSQSITYRLVGKGGTDVSLPETAMQKIVENRNGVITLELTRRSARLKRAATQPSVTQPRATVSCATGGSSASEVSPGPDTGRQAASGTRPAASNTKPSTGTNCGEDLKPYLAASSDLNIKDPVVAELAKKAGGDEKAPVELAVKLCRFVHDYIETKDLSVGFATASEVARSRQGDCTEHGVLLAALGRARGIPSRIVTGIVYTDDFAGQKNVFVGHLWTQFWLAGEWVDVDAAFDQTDVDPTHIALGLSAAGDSGMADLVASGWLGLGKIVLKVIDVK